KTLFGPGIADPLQWTYHDEGEAYEYDADNLSKVVTITRPDGSQRREIYGVHYELNEGRLLGVQTLSPAGTVIESQVLDYLAEHEAANQPFPDIYGLMYGGSGPA